MYCPYCGEKSHVIDTRRRKSGIKYRIRKCKVCEKHFCTVEMYSYQFNTVKLLLKGDINGG